LTVYPLDVTWFGTTGLQLLQPDLVL